MHALGGLGVVLGDVLEVVGEDGGAGDFLLSRVRLTLLGLEGLKL